MSLTKRVGLLGGVAALSLSGGSYADPASDVTNDELRARIAELEGRLSAVEQKDGKDWLTEQRAVEVRSLVQDVLADADGRSSMLAQGMTAGYDDGAVIASADGNWMLRTNLHMQMRFVLNQQDVTAAVGGDDGVWGFENTRTKFILTGNVVSPEWFYKAEIETSASNTRSGIADAYIGYDYGNGWRVYVGTYKAPLLREELVDSRYQLAVERSVVNYFYTANRTDGIAVDYQGDQWHVVGSYSNGMSDAFYGGNIVTGGTSAIASDTDFSITVRGEWLAMGNWDQFMDFTSPEGEETGVMVGAAIHYQTNESGSSVITDLDLLVLTVDVQAEFGGANVFGAFIYADADGAATSSSPLALIMQGGYYFTDSWEGFGRYEWSDLDAGAPDDINIITVGVNKYFAGHNAKWTTDFGVSFDRLSTINGVDPSPLTGYRPDAVGSDGQIVIRSQLQIVF